MKPVKWKMVKSFGLLFVTLLLSNSCTDSELEKPNKPSIHEIDVSDPLYQFVTEDLGFHPDDVVDYGDMYVAEGDIVFDKSHFVIPDGFKKSGESDAPHTHAPGTKEPGGSNERTSQWIANHTMRVARGTQNNITVSINSNVPSSGIYNIRAHITEAIQKWNSVSCSEIRFTLVTGRRGHIEIIDDASLPSSPALVLGSTDFPSGGSPGRTLRLNVDQMVDNQFATSKRTGIIMHELGHAVGFRHTDWSSPGSGETQNASVQVPQTPATDGLSVFIRGLPVLNDFSNSDMVAIRNSYPALTNTTCRAPFYYYWSSTLLDAFYTTQLTHKGGTEFWNYTYQGIACFLHTTQVSGTIPLYTYYSAIHTDHAYKTTTTTWNAAYASQGVAGYIHTSSGSGRVPLYEYWSSERNDYFYTTNWDLLKSGADGYFWQGTVGHVYQSR